MAETDEQHLCGFRLLDSTASLGVGGQGTVCRAVCERTDVPGLAVGTVVALKVISESGVDDERWRRLASMVKTLVHLDAPNVARYYGCFRERAGVVNLHVVAMELLEGETLKERLARTPGGLDADVALDIVRAAAAGLGAAATTGIIHRDVKPDNIFLCGDGSVKLIDFGIARHEGTTTTMNGAPIVGSFDYMAPERTDASFRGDECADVFSLGVVLHEALFGRLPYALQSDRPEFAFFERWSRGARAGALKIDGRAGRIVPGLDEVLIRALNVDRSGRFVGFQALGSALARLSPIEIRSEAETYRVTALIGEGGFGEVFRARRLRDGEVVAVKHLKKMDEGAARRFRGEARAMAVLNDPAFVRFHEYFESGSAAVSQAYLVMACLEGMPGRSLRDVLWAANGAGLPVGDVLEAFAGYAHGLAVLHAHGIVHRDIKPSNLYFAPGCETGSVIMDLGVALDWKTTLTNGLVPGTPDYMPPEIITSESRGSSSADIYALGFCLYEALTGRTAFPRFKSGTSGSFEAFIVRARQKRAPRFDAPLVAANPDLERLLRRMTDPDVDRRMSNAAEAEMELRDLQDAFERGEWNEPQSDGGGNPTEGGETPTVDGVTLDVSTSAASTQEPPPVQTSPSPRLPHRVGMGRIVGLLLVVLVLIGAGVYLWSDRRVTTVRQVVPPMPQTAEPVPMTVVTQKVVQAPSIDTNALMRAAALQRERQERELAKIREQLKASEEARKKAEREAADAEAAQQRLKREQEQSRRKAEEADAKRKADEAARKAAMAKQKVDEAKRQEEEKARQAAVAEEARRQAERDLQRVIAGVQTSAVAIVRHYLDPNAKAEVVEGEHAAWVQRWKDAHASPQYAVEYARAANSIERARSLRPAPKPAPVSAPPPLPADVLRKLEDAAVCLDDGDELGALQIYFDVVASGHPLSGDYRVKAESAFESYRLKNMDAQEIARTRVNSNYNEEKLKRELQQARKYLKGIQGNEKGR